jgi:lipoyl(octanoyl) transferase
MINMPLSAASGAASPATPGPVEWQTSGEVGYADAIEIMERRIDAIARGEAGEMVWLLEHPPLLTAGTSAADAELLAPARFPVFRTGRGGRFTYHGPGQRVGYVMLDLKRRGGDIRKFVFALEEWLIRTAARFGIQSSRRAGRIGVWVERPAKGADFEDKIAALGIRVRKGITFHGVSFNVAPELSHFSAIAPCGIADARYGVTSLADLGVSVSMKEVDGAMRESFAEVFPED